MILLDDLLLLYNCYITVIVYLSVMFLLKKKRTYHLILLLSYHFMSKPMSIYKLSEVVFIDHSDFIIHWQYDKYIWLLIEMLSRGRLQFQYLQSCEHSTIFEHTLHVNSYCVKLGSYYNKFNIFHTRYITFTFNPVYKINIVKHLLKKSNYGFSCPFLSIRPFGGGN